MTEFVSAERQQWRRLLSEHIELRDLRDKLGEELHVIDRRNDSAVIGLIHRDTRDRRRWACFGKKSTHYAPTRWQATLAMIRSDYAAMIADVAHA